VPPRNAEYQVMSGYLCGQEFVFSFVQRRSCRQVICRRKAWAGPVSSASAVRPWKTRFHIIALPFRQSCRSIARWSKCRVYWL
jgi:hypothetical protein